MSELSLLKDVQNFRSIDELPHMCGAFDRDERDVQLKYP